MCALFPLTLTLSLKGEGIDPVGRANAVPPGAVKAECALFPLSLTLSLKGEGIVRANHC